MLTTDEITAGGARLVANKLKLSDQETLISTIRLYLKNRSGFSDLADRLAAVTDTNDSKTGAKLAAILIQLEEAGFSLAELKGGRSGLQSNEVGEFELKIRFALSLLGYTLPEEFSGSVLGGAENISSGGYFPSVTVKKTPVW
jgi:hypothetical protein